MWWDSDVWGGHAGWRASASWQPDTWWPHADWHWGASWQPDTRWHHADWHWRAECPEVFDAAAGLLTDVLAQGVDAARLELFLRSNCARDVVLSLCEKDAWDGLTDPFAVVQGGAGQLDRAPSGNVAVGEDAISKLGPAPSEAVDAAAGLLADVLAQGPHVARLGRVAVAAACATTAPPAAISPGGDESGGIGRVEQASMASSYRGVVFPTALGPAHDGVGQELAWRSHVSYSARSCAGVRTCAGCGIRFSSHKVIDAFCCSVCRQTKGGGHSSGRPTCKRELPEVTTDGSSGPDWDA